MTTRTGGPPESESKKGKIPTTHAPGPGSGLVSSRLLASIVDSSDDAIFGDSLDGIITTWNKAAERIYGYPAGEIVGQPVSVLAPRDRVHEITKTSKGSATASELTITRRRGAGRMARP